MFGVARFEDGHYEEVNITKQSEDFIEFVTSDRRKLVYSPNPRHLFKEYRPIYDDWIYTNRILSVMCSDTKEGREELRGYLMKGEKEMTKHELTEKLLEAQKAVEAARDTLNTAMSDLKKVEKLIEEQAKKPMAYFKSGNRFEIVKYRKYSDSYVEFETASFKYRYIRLGSSKEYVIPRNGLYCTLESEIGHIFETFNSVTEKYEPIDYIDRIELLEGVDEYDSSR